MLSFQVRCRAIGAERVGGEDGIALLSCGPAWNVRGVSGMPMHRFDSQCIARRLTVRDNTGKEERRELGNDGATVQGAQKPRKAKVRWIGSPGTKTCGAGVAR